MGNSYSVAQEEQEEAEFERLVRAVERAERGESAPPELHIDLEAQYHHVEPQGRPPRPGKVMAWFKSRRDNRVAEAEVQSGPFPIPYAAYYSQPAAPGKSSRATFTISQNLNNAQQYPLRLASSQGRPCRSPSTRPRTSLRLHPCRHLPNRLSFVLQYLL